MVGNIMVITVVRVYCCTRKMLKETKSEKKLAFLSHFYHGWHFKREGGRAPLGYAYVPWRPRKTTCLQKESD